MIVHVFDGAKLDEEKGAPDGSQQAEKVTTPVGAVGSTERS